LSLANSPPLAQLPRHLQLQRSNYLPSICSARTTTLMAAEGSSSAAIMAPPPAAPRLALAESWIAVPRAFRKLGTPAPLRPTSGCHQDVDGHRVCQRSSIHCVPPPSSLYYGRAGPAVFCFLHCCPGALSGFGAPPSSQQYHHTGNLRLLV
jgi:hypothetical protein